MPTSIFTCSKPASTNERDVNSSPAVIRCRGLTNMHIISITLGTIYAMPTYGLVTITIFVIIIKNPTCAVPVGNLAGRQQWVNDDLEDWNQCKAQQRVADLQLSASACKYTTSKLKHIIIYTYSKHGAQH
jgi:hypothetical protein